MTTHTHKLYQLSIIAPLLLAVGCSTATLLPKSNDLLKTEQFYKEISNDPKIYQNAGSKLTEASDALEAATKAQSEEEMADFVYISNNKIKTAIEVSKAELAKKRAKDIRDEKIGLQENYYRQKMNK